MINLQERKILSPKIDIVFQKLFGEQTKAEITKDLLEKILGREIKSIDLTKTTKVTADMPEDKKGILDVRAELDDIEHCNIEMQMADQQGIEDRMLFYWNRLAFGEFKAGQQYSEIKKTISILIANFNLKRLKGLEYHTNWKIIDEKERKVILTDTFEIRIIELPKIKGKEKEKDELLDWLFFLENPESERARKSMEKNKVIQDAANELERLNQDEEMRRMAISREIALSDYATNIGAAEKRGIEKGEAIGIKKEKRKVAIELLKMDISIPVIMKATGLTEEEIKALQ